MCNCAPLWFPQHDSQWSPSPCTVCVCSRGSVSCNAHPCPPLTCHGDQSLFTPAGECCPKCGRNGGEGNVWFTWTYRFQIQPLPKWISFNWFFCLLTTNLFIFTVYCTVHYLYLFHTSTQTFFVLLYIIRLWKLAPDSGCFIPCVFDCIVLLIYKALCYWCIQVLVGVSDMQVLRVACIQYSNPQKITW